jgi:Kdo2-lipid IVA lauroyltransferase/acyltransferase
MAMRKVSESSPTIGALARGMLALSARLPLPAARGFGSALGLLAAVVPNQFRRVTRYNLSWCFPELRASERARLLRASLVSMGRGAGEFGAVLAAPWERFNKLVAEVEGEELLARSLSRGGPGPLLLVPHLGNWEVLNPFLVQRGPLVALYRPPRIEEAHRVLLEPRERAGCTMIPATPAGLRDLYRATAAGKLTVVLPDQEPIRRSGVFAPFFGVSALTMTLVARLLRRLRSTALFVFALRTPDGRFTVHFRQPPDGLDDPDLEVAASRLNAGIEQCVREKPEQYLWSYKRFKTRPEEELERLYVHGDPTGVKLYRKHP